MKTKNPKRSDSRRGAVLVVVMGLALLGSIAVSSAAYSVDSRVRQTRKQVALEQAFYLAEAGAERAAARVGMGNNASTTLTDSFAGGTYSVEIQSVSQGGGRTQINITSVGTVDGVSRTVVMRGVRRVNWAQFALWYDSQAVTPMVMVPGEQFCGRFYARPMLRFHDLNLDTLGQVRFFDRAWTCQPSFERVSNRVNPIFDRGLTYNAAKQTIASVDFDELRAAASSGMVLEGPTEIVINNKTMTVTNARKGWNNKAMTVPSDGLVYVRTVTRKSKTYYGDLRVSAPNGLGDRVTLVAERDIDVVDHVRYKNNPQTVTNSTDALGLIARRGVMVTDSAPDDLEIYAHIIAQESGFGVEGYDRGSSRGTLTVYGGIVNEIRQAVGTTSPSGYRKNYIFDNRFTNNPPPCYPEQDNNLQWDEWGG